MQSVAVEKTLMRTTIFPRLSMVTDQTDSRIGSVGVAAPDEEGQSHGQNPEDDAAKMWLAANDEWYCDTASVQQQADDRRMDGQQQK